MALPQQDLCQPSDADNDLLAASVEAMLEKEWEPEALLHELHGIATRQELARRIAQAREEASAPEEKILT